MPTVFPQSQQGSHPVSNWMAIITALSTDMPATGVSLTQMNEAILDMYKILWIGYALNAQSVTLVSNAQATALLAAYNLAFTDTAVSLLQATTRVRTHILTVWQANGLKAALLAFVTALS